MRQATILGLIILGLCMAGHAQTMQPPVPTNLVGQSPPELQPRVLLGWNAPAGPWFFKVYRSTPDTTNFQWIGISQNRTFEDPAVQAGLLYHYVVTAAVFQDSVIREGGRSKIATVRAYGLSPGPKGIITGRVTEDVTGTPLPKVRIRFFQLLASMNRGVELMTDAAGVYRAEVDTGSYIIRAEEISLTAQLPAHAPEFFENAATPETATPVRVRINDTMRVDFGLRPNTPAPYAYISGMVTDDTGSPIAGAAVAFVRPIQELNTLAATTAITPGLGPEAVTIPGIGYTRGVVWVGFTNPSGKYFAQVLSNRPYIAMAAKDGYTRELYNNTSDPTEATIIAVRDDTTGINFSLMKHAPENTGQMQGTVTAPGGEEVPARIILFPRPKGGEERPAVFVHTDSIGAFNVEELEAGIYSVLALPYSEYAPAYYRSGELGAVSWLDADTVVVNGSPAALTITLPVLQSGGLTRISGRVLAANRAPLPGVRVVARKGDGSIGAYGLTDPLGYYAIDAVTAGPLTLFVDRFNYTLIQAPVTIAQNTYSVTNVDFILSTTYPTAAEDDPAVPYTTRLYANYPNPFNPSTVIAYDIAVAGRVELRVYDLLGREVGVLVNGVQGAGRHAVVFDAGGLPSGVYFTRLTVGGMERASQTGRMMLVR
jgi:hypothetical protein